jgi:hypothetical protein
VPAELPLRGIRTLSHLLSAIDRWALSIKRYLLHQVARSMPNLRGEEEQQEVTYYSISLRRHVRQFCGVRNERKKILTVMSGRKVWRREAFQY